MAVTTQSTMDQFSVQDTTDDNDDVEYVAKWSDGYPPYQYEIRDKETLDVLDSGTTDEQRTSGVITGCTTDSFTMRVTDAGGDIISTTTFNVS